MELATDEKTLLALDPIRRSVPTAIARITANMIAYSAMSWAQSSRQSCSINSSAVAPAYGLVGKTATKGL